MRIAATPILLPVLAALLTSAAPRPASAATWYFLRYHSPSGSKFTSLSGEMVVPDLPRAGVYYIWPGLQPTDSSGVYQNVLDGRSGSWWIGSGWCCSNPNLEWGDGFSVAAGDTVGFDNVLNADGSGWISTLTRGRDGKTAANAFPLASKSFNQAIFAIELTDVRWDFGPLIFKDVTITATSASTNWCTQLPENYDSTSEYVVSGAKATSWNNTITCKIDTIVLQQPK